MPAGDPVLGNSRGDRQLLRNDVKDSNASSGHARDCPATPGRARPAIAAGALAPLAPPRRPPEPLPQRPDKVRPMSRLMRDVSPGTYVMNPDTPSSIGRIARPCGRFSFWGARHLGCSTELGITMTPRRSTVEINHSNNNNQQANPVSRKPGQVQWPTSAFIWPPAARCAKPTAAPGSAQATEPGIRGLCAFSDGLSPLRWPVDSRRCSRMQSRERDRRFRASRHLPVVSRRQTYHSRRLG